MTETEQRRAVTRLLIAGALCLLAFILHNSRAEAQVTCRLITKAYPAMQLSMVSKECWGSPTIAPVIPRPKPIIQVEVKKKVVKRRGVCGSKRQVWRTLKSGKKRYRCR